jgi:hypothetical protein
MNFLRSFLYLVLLALSPLTSFARLGESETACDMRYNHGQQISQTSNDRYSPLVTGPMCTNKTYNYQGWKIRIGFLQNLAARVEYSKTTAGDHVITAEEVNAILEGNGGLSSWRQVTLAQFPNPTKAISDVFRRASGRTVWYRADGSFAYLRPANYFFRIENGRALQADAAAEVKPVRSVPKF